MAPTCNKQSLLCGIASTVVFLLLTCVVYRNDFKSSTRRNGIQVVARSDNTRRQQWDAWFISLVGDGATEDKGIGIASNITTKNNILYYHVKKTGGSTLYHLFDDINKKNGAPINPGTTPHGHGIGYPGELSRFVSWRNQVNRSNPSERRLLTISFREPVERVISHYFQLKPCPDGTGGGFDKLCAKSAAKGFSAYLSSCSKFASNYQSRYLNGDPSLINKFDFLILNDRSEESLILASIRFQIPIRDLLQVHNRKVRVGTGDLQTNGTIDININDTSNKLHPVSCTAQWMKRLIPPDKLQEVEACTHSCAGKFGRLIFTPEELNHVKASNVRDIDLWENHVIPKYNTDKRKVFEEYGVTQDDLDKVVEAYGTLVSQA